MDEVIQPTEAATQVKAVEPVVAEQPAQETKTEAPSLRDELAASLSKIKNQRPDASRDEAGKFTKAQEAQAAQPGTQAPAAAAAAPDRPGDMPKAWGADKAAHWSSLSPEAKAYIAEREAKMEEFHGKFSGLQRFHDMAAANGNTLPAVLERVANIENQMLQDPTVGFVMAGQMVGMTPEQTAQALFGALKRLGYDPQQPQAGQERQEQGQPMNLATLPEFQALKRDLDGLKQSATQQVMASTLKTVEAFFADPANKFAKDVEADIAREIKAMRAIGQEPDLKAAYERALWTRPDIRQKLIDEQVQAAAQAKAAAQARESERVRQASRSIAGAPPNGEGRASGIKPGNLREELATQLRARLGQV